MATKQSTIDYLMEQLHGIGDLNFKRMFGEYMIYLNQKPILLVCDDTVFVKKLPELDSFKDQFSLGFPYKTAKEHYVVNCIDDANKFKEIAKVLESVIALPKKRTSKK